MNHYIDFQARPVEAISESAVLSALFSHIHLALVQERRSDVGVSFPNAEKNLGDKIRVHSTAETLTMLAKNPGLKRLRDYHHSASVASIPDEHQWCLVIRRQPPITYAKARRMIKRGTLSTDEAQTLIAKRGRLDDPYLSIKSSSSGQHFKLFIVQQLLDSTPECSQTFNSYGLGGAVPWF